MGFFSPKWPSNMPGCTINHGSRCNGCRWLCSSLNRGLCCLAFVRNDYQFQREKHVVSWLPYPPTQWWLFDPLLQTSCPQHPPSQQALQLPGQLLGQVLLSWGPSRSQSWRLPRIRPPCWTIGPCWISPSQISHTETQHFEHGKQQRKYRMGHLKNVVAVFDHVDHIHIVLAIHQECRLLLFPTSNPPNRGSHTKHYKTISNHSKSILNPGIFQGCFSGYPIEKWCFFLPWDSPQPSNHLCRQAGAQPAFRRAAQGCHQALWGSDTNPMI